MSTMDALAVKLDETIPPTPKSLVTKLAEVMGEVERVAKHGRNDFHKYDYATEADITSAVRQHMATRHLMLVPSVETVEWRDGKSGPIAMMNVLFTVHDGENGETLAFHIFSEGQDSGDKALYKAMTGATKYALLKLFLIPTGDDPEHDGGGRNGAQGRADRREAAAAQTRNDSATKAPYAAREAAKGGATTIDKETGEVVVAKEEWVPPSFKELMARRATLPVDVQVHIPLEEDMHAFPPKDLTDLIPGYIDAITDTVKRRKLKADESAELKAMFLGNPRAQLSGQKHNPFFIYALFKHMRTDQP